MLNRKPLYTLNSVLSCGADENIQPVLMLFRTPRSHAALAANITLAIVAYAKISDEDDEDPTYMYQFGSVS